MNQISKATNLLRNRLRLLLSSIVACFIGCSPSTELDQKIASVDSELQQLPKLQPNMLCPTVGFGSAIFPTPDHTSWLDIILPEPKPIDSVALIPALLRNQSGELETLGFPHRFTIEAWQDPSEGTQSVKLAPGGWLYQPIGIFDSAQHPLQLDCELSLNQSRYNAGSAPVSVSLYYSSSFEPVDNIDLHGTTGVVQVGHTIELGPWTQWATVNSKQVPHNFSSKFDLSSVPSGVTLYLRIANTTTRSDATIDEVTVSPPFQLINGDFESNEIPNKGVYHDITNWFDITEDWRATQQSKFQSGSNYSQGNVIVDYSQIDYPNPGAAPVVFNFPSGTVAEKIRIRSIRMQEEASWRKEQGHNFALNEVLLFNGEQNIALNAETASSDNENFPLMFDSNYAVDGYSYFPPVDPKQVSSPQTELVDNPNASNQLFFDLGKSYQLDQVRFYPVDRSPQFSHIYAMGIGFPRKITLHVSDELNPTQATQIQINTLQQIGASPLSRRLENVKGRYVWIEMDEGQRDPRTEKDALGFSEIELHHNGVNLLRGIQASSASKQDYHHLTDGLTSSGIIIPEKQWLLSLSRRAQLQAERALLVERKEQLSTRQSRLIALLQVSMLCFLIAALVITLMARSRHRQHLRQLREKIGANLHDEVGANLSSIALSSELLEHSYNLDTPKAHRLIDDINRIARETATEIRLLSRFLEKQDVESNLIGQLRRIEQQMLPSLQTKTDYEAPERFNALSAIEKWELVLFFKEALHNIIKHSGATQVSIRTYGEGRELHLEISDNGTGFNDENPPPVHLVKRAKKLRANLDIQSSETTGTSIQLSIPKKKLHPK